LVVLYVLADTSVWLDLSKDVQGQKLIAAIRTLVDRGFLTLLVPEIVLEEFERNRSRVEADMTRGLSATFRRVRDEIEQYGQDKRDAALTEIDNWVAVGLSIAAGLAAYLLMRGAGRSRPRVATWGAQ
jgi:hypothetical protein